jgi:hypothetical protein
VISSSQGLYLNTGQHKHIYTPNIHDLSGIRTKHHGLRAKTVHALDGSATLTVMHVCQIFMSLIGLGFLEIFFSCTCICYFSRNLFNASFSTFGLYRARYGVHFGGTAYWNSWKHCSVVDFGYILKNWRLISNNEFGSLGIRISRDRGNRQLG